MHFSKPRSFYGKLASRWVKTSNIGKKTEETRHDFAALQGGGRRGGGARSRRLGFF
jgi:hypothetical protein